MSVNFDPKKDAANIKKHGVSLAEGDGVLGDPLALTVKDDSAVGEQRFNYWNECLRYPDGRCTHAPASRATNDLSAEA